jgi:hypothetical protein
MWFCTGGLLIDGDARASGREGSTCSGELLKIYKMNHKMRSYT